ncbi:MAG TPA: hypothetical protein VLR49_12030, partial [Ferruginibacter sp.]|nr:hypothetical protein [Ferruginibacter sp.]
SLMIGLGKIFNESTIYASESWVMAKPGIFANKYGFAGYPFAKKIKISFLNPHGKEWENGDNINTAQGKLKISPL